MLHRTGHGFAGLQGADPMGWAVLGGDVLGAGLQTRALVKNGTEQENDLGERGVRNPVSGDA